MAKLAMDFLMIMSVEEEKQWAKDCTLNDEKKAKPKELHVNGEHLGVKSEQKPTKQNGSALHGFP